MSNFYHRVAGAAAEFSSRPAIDVGASSGITTVTYRELILHAGRFAAWLEQRADVAPGHRVAILANNGAEWVAAYLGVLQLGAIAVPLDTAYTSSQIGTIIQDSGARVLFTAARYVDTARAAIVGLPEPPVIALLAGAAPGIAGPDDVAPQTPLTRVADVSQRDAAVILYTSGTTADPKGVVLTHGNLDAERAAAFQVVHVTEQDRVLGVLPLFHALAQMANLLLPLSVGACVMFLDTVSSATLIEALQSRGITIFACVPQFFYLIHERVVGDVSRRGPLAVRLFRAMLSANTWVRNTTGWNPGRRVFSRVHRTLGTSLRLLITGGSRFDPAIGRDLHGLGFAVLNAYGLTETSGGATIVRAGDRFTTSVGPPFPGVEIRIAAAPRDPTIDQEDDGEILIRGPIVMREYFGRPDATAEVIKDGWLCTGDLGRLDEDGRLYITGRKKELIVLSSGKNIYPEEIEAHYRRSPWIKELCVVGRSLPGQPSAERLHAVVVVNEPLMRERGVVNITELLRFEVEGLSVQLPAHKRILGYDVTLEPLPRTTTGKLRRTAVERIVRERATTAAIERPLTQADREWLDRPAHAALAEVTRTTLEKTAVHPDDNLELDLGLDSMERVELLTALERHAHTRVPPETRATIYTVRHLVEAVTAAPAADGRADPDESGPLAWDAILAEAAPADLVAELGRPKAIRAALLFAAFRVLRGVVAMLVRLRVTGAGNVPAGPCIVCPNHQSFLDGGFVAASLSFRDFRRQFLVGAAEYYQSGSAARLARAVNIIPVDPDTNLVTAMRAAAAGLRLGKALVLFPEGERSIDGATRPFRKGAAILAGHLDVPIVPVAIDGLFEIWPRGRGLRWTALLPWRGTRVTIAFGTPMRVEAGRPADATRDIEAAVRALHDAARSR